MKVKMFQIPDQLFQANLNYLATKPFQEVNQLMQALFAGARVVEVDVPDPAEAPKLDIEEKTNDDKAGA